MDEILTIAIVAPKRGQMRRTGPEPVATPSGRITPAGNQGQVYDYAQLGLLPDRRDSRATRQC
jgi:hypothetical protein